jgi:hypothetical protein
MPAHRACDAIQLRVRFDHRRDRRREQPLGLPNACAAMARTAVPTPERSTPGSSTA